MLFSMTIAPGFLPGKVVYGQHESDSLLSVAFHERIMRSVLAELSELTSINLSYNASATAFDQFISYNARDKTAAEILEEVLSIINHEYQQVSNHFVIVQSPVLPDLTTPEQVAQKPVKNQSPIPEQTTDQSIILRVDTVFIEKKVPVYLHDTLHIFDTVFSFRTDTILDTVFIQQRPAHTGIRLRGISSDVFRFEADRYNSWAIGISYTQMAAGYNHINARNLNMDEQTIKDAEAFSLRNFKLGVQAQYNRNRLNLTAGINVAGFSNRFSWSETNRTGGFYLTDTLDVFYTIAAGDTSWVVIEDSTYIPLDESIKHWDRFNRIGLIELQVSLAYQIIAADYYSLYLKAGMLAAVPIWLNSRSVQNSEGFPVIELSRNDFPSWLYGYQAGIGLRYAFSNWMDLYAEPYYIRYLNPTYDNHPLERRLHGFGFQFGLLYYL